ncbi:unnamed protein product [Caenorhabditis sp. 36 PRJEB53466]|nr:unnamed protein product [Caenorhabditis sp. 36 PRJEB53466]
MNPPAPIRPQPTGPLIVKAMRIAEVPFSRVVYNQIKRNVKSSPFHTALQEVFRDQKTRLMELNLQKREKNKEDAEQEKQLDEVLTNEMMMGHGIYRFGDPTDWRDKLPEVRTIYEHEMRNFELQKEAMLVSIRTVLQKQTEYRPITDEDIECLLEVRSRPMIRVRLGLKRSMCDIVIHYRETSMRTQKVRKFYGGTSKSDILNSYFHANIFDQFPSKAVKMELAKKCGITHKEVSMWFNAKRSRQKNLMKRVIEEEERTNGPKYYKPMERIISSCEGVMDPFRTMFALCGTKRSL